MREGNPVPSASAELPCSIVAADAGPMGVDPLRAVLPLLGDILVECRMVVADAQGHVVGEDSAQHHFTSAAAPIRDPETGAVVGAVDVTGPARTVHPTTSALLLAAARLAEGFLRAQVAVRDARRLGDGPGAVLSSDGRVLAAEPPGWLPSRVALPSQGDRVTLPDGTEGVLIPLDDGYLLRPVAAFRPRA
jgi:hypothetical protein